MPNPNKAAETQKGGVADLLDLPRFKRLPDLELYLQERGYSLDRLRQVKKSVGERQDLAQVLKKSGENGRVEKLTNYLPKVGQELERKESFLSKTGETLKKPFKWTFEAMKKHSYITVAVILALLGIAAYYSGIGGPIIARIKQFIMSKFAGKGVADAAEIARKAAETTAGKAGEVIDTLPPLSPGPIPAPPGPLQPLPDIPSPEQIEQILHTLKTSG